MTLLFVELDGLWDLLGYISMTLALSDIRCMHLVIWDLLGYSYMSPTLSERL